MDSFFVIMMVNYLLCDIYLIILVSYMISICYKKCKNKKYAYTVDEKRAFLIMTLPCSLWLHVLYSKGHFPKSQPEGHDRVDSLLFFVIVTSFLIGILSLYLLHRISVYVFPSDPVGDNTESLIKTETPIDEELGQRGCFL
jgi:hypothetical protein